MMSDNEHPVILFDGVCNLCNASVQFVIRHDKKAIFRFAALQSDYGKNVLQHNHLPLAELNSFILQENGRIYRRSSAALRVVRRLNFAWNLLYAFIIIPRPLRDIIYDLVSKNRYKWFGRQDYCMIPTPELKNRFLT